MDDEAISWFPVPDPSEVPADLRGLFAKAEATLGFVPNVFRAYAFRPERLRTWFAHFKQLHEATEHSFTNRMSLATGMLPNREYHALHR